MVKGRKICKNKRWVLYWGKQEDEVKKKRSWGGRTRKEKGLWSECGTLKFDWW